VPQIVESIPNMKDITTGSGYIMALSKANELYAWGDNSCGQLGDGTKSIVTIPKIITIPGITFSKIECGRNTTIGLTNKGNLYTCGENDFGQLGISSMDNKSLLTRIYVAPTTNIVYDYTTNGGSEETSVIRYKKGDGIDLSITDDSDSFIGWNVDSDATNGLYNLYLKGNFDEITLYAIYKNQKVVFPNIQHANFVIAEGSNNPMLRGNNCSFTANLDKGYQGNLQLYIGNTKLNAVNGIYTINNITEDIIITDRQSTVNTTNYVINYVLDGGNNSSSNPLSYNVDDSDFILQNPTKKGYTFLEWTEGKNIYTSKATVLTRTANWIINNYTISYELNGGFNDASNPLTYTIANSNIMLQNPTKKGYTFDSWDKGSTVNTANADNQTREANWTIINYEIEYVLNGGSNNSYNPISYNVEDDAIILRNPTKQGYTFVNWTEGSNIVTSKAIKLTKTANWAINNYTISYNLNGGINSQHNSKIYNIEQEDFSLQSPTKTGYTFTFWSDGALIETSLAKNITKTANWNLNTYAITYKLDSGENSVCNPDNYNVERGDIALYNPSKSGYTFINWEEGYCIDISDAIDVTRTAIWSINTYNVTYQLDGGINNGNNPLIYTVADSNITLQNPSKNGYTFKNWKEGETIDTSITFNIKRTAIWEINTYQITYVLNGGKNNENNLSNYKVENSDFTLQNPSRKGYTFSSWSQGKVVDTSKAMDITRTACWIKNNYTITYNLNGGINNESNPINYNIEQSNITLLEPTKEGFTFLAWTEGAFINTANAYNITRTATWTNIAYTITYMLDGGSNNPNNPKSYTVEDSDIVLLNPNKVGYTFLSWTEGKNIDTSNALDLIKTAIWTKNTFEISFIKQDKTIIEIKTGCLYGDLVTIPTPVLKYEDLHFVYEFRGWEPEVAKHVDGDATYTAMYNEKCKELMVSVSAGFENDVDAKIENKLGFTENSIFTVK